MSGIIAVALAALAISPPLPAAPTPDALIARWIHGSQTDRPRINVWVNRDDPYNRGDQARVYFKADRDAYITIVRIDTDGRLRVLFPIDPWEDNWARGGKTFEVLGRDKDQAFRVDDAPGVGYIFGIASYEPFEYDQIVRGDHWDYRVISDGRVRGDPYVAVSDLAERITTETDYDYDVAEYDVERHYDYPRFVCYDCHAYASWHYWDPYSASCNRFRIVIYNDPYYYPYRYYGSGVVIVRPYRPGPRYVFKDADPRNDYITRVAQRPRGTDDDRRGDARDRTSTDVGGRGAIPAPVGPRTRRPSDDNRRGADPSPTTPKDDARRRPESRDGVSDPARPDQPDTRDEPRRHTDSRGNGNDNPNRTAQPATGDAPRRHTDPRASGNDNPDRTAQPAPGDEPRRTIRETDGAESGRAGRPDTGGDAPQRRAGDDRGGSASPDAAPHPDTPDRRAPEAREPRQPPSEPPRTAPAPRDQPPRAQPQPRSTGDPQLKRRRP